MSRETFSEIEQAEEPDNRVTRLLWVRQYAHTVDNMGRAHIGMEGESRTLCGLGIRSTAVWGHQYREGAMLRDTCHRCEKMATHYP